ncbi:MAG: ATP-binding protein [Paludibacteraceae bacterium]|nr:ATP-binding protein [Paludibacteraceae bacterium]
MKPVLNPFFVKCTIPTAYFCDRVKETDTLAQLLLNGNNVVLTSPRRMGKTGLIAHVLQQPRFQDNYYLFFVDILETSSLREMTYALGREIFSQLKSRSKGLLDQFIQTVRSISGQFGYDPLTGTPTFSLSLGSIENPEYTLSEIFAYIGQADKRCIIAIDEFQQIVNYPEKNVEAILRSHIQRCQNAEFIFAGSQRHILAEMFHQSSRPFFASTSDMNLDIIAPDKYIQFASRCFEEFGKKLDCDTIPALYTLFNGNTFCLQKTMNRAFSLTEKGKRCDADTIQKAIADILSDNERGYQNQLSMLSTKPKELLFAIAKEGEAQQITSGAFVRKHKLTSPSSVQSATKQLLDEGWITFTSDSQGKRIYRIEDAFFAIWCKQRFE